MNGSAIRAVEARLFRVPLVEVLDDARRLRECAYLTAMRARQFLSVVVADA
jgi:hypothetical protein